MWSMLIRVVVNIVISYGIESREELFCRVDLYFVIDFWFIVLFDGKSFYVFFVVVFFLLYMLNWLDDVFLREIYDWKCFVGNWLCRIGMIRCL